MIIAEFPGLRGIVGLSNSYSNDISGTFWVAQWQRICLPVQETWGIPGSGRSLEKETAAHSSILVWKIPWREEAGWPQSMRSQKSDTTERLRII